jgi:hypothetical protein
MDDNGGDGLSRFGQFMLIVGCIGAIGFLLVLMSAGQ